MVPLLCSALLHVKSLLPFPLYSTSSNLPPISFHLHPIFPLCPLCPLYSSLPLSISLFLSILPLYYTPLSSLSLFSTISHFSSLLHLHLHYLLFFHYTQLFLSTFPLYSTPLHSIPLFLPILSLYSIFPLSPIFPPSPIFSLYLTHFLSYSTPLHSTAPISSPSPSHLPFHSTPLHPLYQVPPTNQPTTHPIASNQASKLVMSICKFFILFPLLFYYFDFINHTPATPLYSTPLHCIAPLSSMMAYSTHCISFFQLYPILPPSLSIPSP